MTVQDCYKSRRYLEGISMGLIVKSVRFKEEQIISLEKIGKIKDRNFSWLVRKSVDEYIKQNKI